MGFKSLFSNMLDSSFELIAETVVYAPVVGDEIILSGIFQTASLDESFFNTGAYVPSHTIDIKLDDLVDPQEGDSVTFDGTSYLVGKIEKKHDATIWHLGLREQIA